MFSAWSYFIMDKEEPIPHFVCFVNILHPLLPSATAWGVTPILAI